MNAGTNAESKAINYRRVMLQRVVDLSQKHGGIKRIPARILEENGIDLTKNKGATQVIIALPDPEVMQRRIDESLPIKRPAQREVESFKLAPEPTPRAITQRPATMEDFWIEQGWYRIDRNGWKLIRAKWNEDDEVRVEAIRFLVEQVLQKDPKDVTFDDFRKNKLGGVLGNYYSNSPLNAVTEAYPKEDIQPWEMPKTPQGFFDEKENRVAAIRWLVERLDKDPRDLTSEDFHSNRLVGLFKHYSDSPHAVVVEVFPNLNIKAWEMLTTPNGFFEEKGNRIAAVKWLAEKLGKDPRDLTTDDFYSNRLGGLMNINHYSGSVYAAVSEVFPRQNIMPWEMITTPMRFFEKRENRIKAVKWLAKKLDKDPRDLTTDDFYSNRVTGVLRNSQDSIHKSVDEAFPEQGIKPWEMTVTHPGFFDKRENRIKAVKWLAKKLDKDPRDLTVDDFTMNRLGGLFCHHYASSPYKAVTEAFPEKEVMPWEMIVTPRGFFESRENRVEAIKWLAKKVGNDPRDLNTDDFTMNRLGGLMNHYSGSIYAAVSEAFPEQGIKPWEMNVTPRGFFDKKRNCVEAVRWLAKKLDKDPRDLTSDDFYSNRLSGLIGEMYNGSPYAAVSHAFPEQEIRAWEMAKSPTGFYEKKENRIEAVRWLVEKVNKDPRDLREEDFISNRLYGLLASKYYLGSPHKAVSEAFPELNIHPWEMAVTPTGFYKNRKNRIAAIRWLAEKLGKDPREITQREFISNRLHGLINKYYSASPYEALLEAGLVTQEDERYIRGRKCGSAT